MERTCKHKANETVHSANTYQGVSGPYVEIKSVILTQTTATAAKPSTKPHCVDELVTLEF